MEIITPDITDLFSIFRQAETWFDQMDFGLYGNGFDYNVVIPWLQTVLTSPDFECLLAKENGVVVGIFIVFYKTRHTWHAGPMQACEMAWHANPSLHPIKRGKIMISLLKEMARVVKLRLKPEESFFVGYDPRPEFASVGRYLERKGFIDTSHVMMAKAGGL